MVTVSIIGCSQSYPFRPNEELTTVLNYLAVIKKMLFQFEHISSNKSSKIFFSL